MIQRFDIETNIAPPMRAVITLVHKSGIVVYVARPAFGPCGDDKSLGDIARRIADVLTKEIR